MSISSNEYDMLAALDVMEEHTELLRYLFRDIFGEESARNMPCTAEAINNYFICKLRDAGTCVVDMNKISHVIVTINCLRQAERQFNAATESIIK